MCTYMHSSVQPACMLTVVILSTIHTCTWLEHTLYLPLCNPPCPTHSLHCITCGYAVIRTGRGARNLELWVLKSSKYFTCYCCYVVCHIPNILYRMAKQETLFDFGVSSPLPTSFPPPFSPSLPPYLPPPPPPPPPFLPLPLPPSPNSQEVIETKWQDLLQKLEACRSTLSRYHDLMSVFAEMDDCLTNMGQIEVHSQHVQCSMYSVVCTV